MTFFSGWYWQYTSCWKGMYQGLMEEQLAKSIPTYLSTVIHSQAFDLVLVLKATIRLILFHPIFLQAGDTENPPPSLCVSL
ncbi:hypothetical protein FKM82_000880 [Ascaphus truei]